MIVGQIYEDRVGQYRVVAVERDVVRYQYLNSSRVLPGDVSLKHQIHESIQSERRAMNRQPERRSCSTSIVNVNLTAWIRSRRHAIHCYASSESLAEHAAREINVSVDDVHVANSPKNFTHYSVLVHCESNDVLTLKTLYDGDVIVHADTARICSKDIIADLIRKGSKVGINEDPHHQ